MWILIGSVAALAQSFPIPGTPITALGVEYQIWEVPEQSFPNAQFPEDASLLSSSILTVPVVLQLASVAPNGAEEVANFFSAILCDELYTSAPAVEAVDMLQRLGMPFDVLGDTTTNCGAHYPGNKRWKFRDGSQGQPLLDAENQIIMIWGSDDRNEPSHVAGRAFIYGVEHRNEYGEVRRVDLTWEIMLNLNHFDFLATCPSQALVWDGKAEGFHLTDAIVHELMHVLGAQHISGSPFPSPDLHSTMQKINDGGHFALESFGDPHNPELDASDPAICGEYSLPLADQAFLAMAHPGYFEEEVVQGRLYNWKYINRGGNFWYAGPTGAPGMVGPGSGNFISLGSYCPGDEITVDAQDLIATKPLALTRGGLAGTAYVAYAGRTIPDTVSHTYETLMLMDSVSASPNMGWAEYEPTGGTDWEASFVSGPGTKIQYVDAVPANDSYFDRNYYLLATYYGYTREPTNGRSTFLPLGFYIWPQCPSPTGGTCCGVQ